jgi:hypothetical protein
MAKTTLHLQLYKPYLNQMEADEIRAEIIALNPRLHLVMPDWPWLEVRGISEKQAEGIMESLRARTIRFSVLAAGKKNTKARVQVSETLEVC